jgi:hypothetical protein
MMTQVMEEVVKIIIKKEQEISLIEKMILEVVLEPIQQWMKMKS